MLGLKKFWQSHKEYEKERYLQQLELSAKNLIGVRYGCHGDTLDVIAIRRLLREEIAREIGRKVNE